MLFPFPLRLERSIDMHEMVEDLGFVVDHKGEQGYVTFQHPDLILEFLVAARGREPTKPVPLIQLGINAQALRFMDMLTRDPVEAMFEDVSVAIPHPVDFALHKLLIAGRRSTWQRTVRRELCDGDADLVGLLSQ